MKKIVHSFFVLFTFTICSLYAEEGNNAPAPEKGTTVKIEPFTGKITKNKVRLRLQPSYDAQVLRELKKSDMVVVLGETEDFYALKPPADLRGYVFRTYVLDNVIEGTRVNVRLKADLDAPVLAQLNSGDRVDGRVDPTNNKWLEIKLPETARVFVAKEYIEKAGDAGLMARLEKKNEEVYRLLNTTEAIASAEMQKPFEQMNIEGIKANYQHIILDFPEFPEAADKARELQAKLQDNHTAKKLAYLETQAQRANMTHETNKKLAAELKTHKSTINELNQQLEQRPIIVQPQGDAVAYSTPKKPIQLPINMASWVPQEETMFASWNQQSGGEETPQSFYDAQRKEGFVMKGIVEGYNRPVKNKPGDYLLVNPSSKLPYAFLYSTQVNLQDYIGHEVAVVVAPRPNNNFAFPAYFVLSLE